MNLKKILAGALASVMAVSTMAAVANAADTPTVDEGVAFIGFGDSDWKASFWGKSSDHASNPDYKDYKIVNLDYMTTAKITGNGTYTVAVDLSKGYNGVGQSGIMEDEEAEEPIEYTTANSIGAMGIQIYGENPKLGVDIKSIKIDGKAVELKGVSYTNDEDGGRRTNIYNEWASYDASKEDHLTKDADKATGKLIDKPGEWSKIEVEFEVYGLDTAADNNDSTQAPEGDVTTGAAGDVNKPSTDKNQPNTGVEGVAVVAGLAVLAAGAIVVAKKRK